MPTRRTSRRKRVRSRRRTSRRQSQTGGYVEPGHKFQSYLDMPRKFPPLPPLELKPKHNSPRRTRFVPAKEHRERNYDEEITSYVREAHKQHQRPTYPPRESHYTPWEKIKYSFIKDDRQWPPKPNQPYRLSKESRKVAPIDY